MTSTDVPRRAPRRTETEYAVPVRLRDGTHLSAVVTRPLDVGRVPVVLMHTPYPPEGARFDVDEAAVIRAGLALVLVSHRGTGSSEGRFEPWVDDAQDGADLIAWCAEQSWSTGEVVTLGRSYHAQTQLYAAGTAPDPLRAMALGVCPSDPYDVVHVGGALALGSALGWAVAQAGGLLAREVERGEADAEVLDRWTELAAGFAELVRPGAAPRSAVLDAGFPAWRTWLEHPARDGWWQERALPHRPAIPAFWVGGWFDIFLRGTLSEFSRARHPRSRLVVGPWGHGAPGASLGEVRFGLGASGLGIGLDEQVLGFLARQLEGDARSGTPDRDAEDGTVLLYVMGADRWHRTTAWPPPESRDLTLHLRTDGRLLPEAPTEEDPPATYVHDPLDPVPTIGGNNLFLDGDAAHGTGPWDQRPLDRRPDVLRFSTDPLDADLDVVGVVRLSLVASTSAVDTDWCAKLVDVHPDGTATNVVDGVLRARFHRTDEVEELLEPGVPHRLEVEVGPTAQRFAAGHRLRLDLASSNHPRLDVNPGDGGTWAQTPAEQYVVAHQAVHVDRDRPSVLILPVLDPSATCDQPRPTAPPQPSSTAPAPR